MLQADAVDDVVDRGQSIVQRLRGSVRRGSPQDARHRAPGSDAARSPMTPQTMKSSQNTRGAVAGSPNQSMPTSAMIAMPSADHTV